MQILSPASIRSRGAGGAPWSARSGGRAASTRSRGVGGASRRTASIRSKIARGALRSACGGAGTGAWAPEELHGAPPPSLVTLPPPSAVSPRSRSPSRSRSRLAMRRSTCRIVWRLARLHYGGGSEAQGTIAAGRRMRRGAGHHYSGSEARRSPPPLRQ
jgi:hypothetical protein